MGIYFNLAFFFNSYIVVELKSGVTQKRIKRKIILGLWRKEPCEESFESFGCGRVVAL